MLRLFDNTLAARRESALALRTFELALRGAGGLEGLRPEAEMEGVAADSVINAILAHVPVPR